MVARALVGLERHRVFDQGVAAEPAEPDVDDDPPPDYGADALVHTITALAELIEAPSLH